MARRLTFERLFIVFLLFPFIEKGGAKKVLPFSRFGTVFDVYYSETQTHKLWSI